jgi:hypothetical protein
MHKVGRQEREVLGDLVKKEACEGFQEQVGNDTFACHIESF